MVFDLQPLSRVYILFRNSRSDGESKEKACGISENAEVNNISKDTSRASGPIRGL